MKIVLIATSLVLSTPRCLGFIPNVGQNHALKLASKGDEKSPSQHHQGRLPVCRRTRLFSSASDPPPSSSTTNELPQIPFLTKTVDSDRSADLMLGEDAGVFDIQNENWGQLGEDGWLTFSAAVGTIMTAVAVLWVYPFTGYSDDFLAFLEGIAGGNSHIVTLIFGIIFPIVHSGLASLRPLGEKVVGARVWRVIFAFPSLCLAYSWITYYISHAHDGIQFYDLSGNDAAHTVAWITNFLSFFFLYPSVFNLKEVAAVEKPKIHLWETVRMNPKFLSRTEDNIMSGCQWFRLVVHHSQSHHPLINFYLFRV